MLLTLNKVQTNLMKRNTKFCKIHYDCILARFLLFYYKNFK